MIDQALRKGRYGEATLGSSPWQHWTITRTGLTWGLYAATSLGA